MRYMLFALVFVALACTKSDPPAEPEARANAEEAAHAEAKPQVPRARKAAQPALEPETTPVVTLVDAGKPPLEELRRTFKTGQKETMSFQVGETITMKGDEWDSLHTPLALLQTIDIETVAVSGGVAEVSLVVRGAEEVAGSAEKPNTKQMNPTGVTGRYKINTQGVVTELDLVPPPNNPSVQKPFLDSMRSKLRTMAPAFPKEPVGVGAKWKVSTEVNEFLTHLKEEITVELVARTESEIVLRFEVKSSGKRHHDFEPPQDVTVDVEASGQATLSSSHIVPRSSAFDQLIVQKATLLDTDPPKGATQTLKYEVKAGSK